MTPFTSFWTARGGADGSGACKKFAWKVPQGARLPAQAKNLGVSVDDLLTTDTQEIACEAYRL
jgi:hypothetical protein